MIDPDAHCQPISSAPLETVSTGICIAGGGMAGVCAALAAARGGAKVTLLQDRPMLGGNASSEVRMWICGAHGRFYKESGILEELQLLNIYRNPTLKYPLWDHVLYEKILGEPNITLLLSSAICEVRTAGDRIESVKAWHLTRQCWIEVRATQFIDCSGDSILRYSGASHRWGREEASAYGETLGKETADRKTMGNTILIQLREIDPADHQPFIPPSFARKLDDTHPRAKLFQPSGHNFWWLEIGGESDTIEDADTIRDELYGIAYGVWDYIKNHPDGRGEGWELEWIGSLPGKRENVRYTGLHTLTQQEVEAQGKFPDVIAFGGWTMDDHPTAAFEHPGKETTHHPVPSPYGIPFGVLVSQNIANLMFAGRNISATHMAFSSTRVMATCAMLGQAAGTACAMAVNQGIAPAEVAARMAELQNRLLDADQWLPGRTRLLPAITRSASLTGEGLEGDLQVLNDGHERRLPDGDHGIHIRDGGHLAFRWPAPVPLRRLRLVVQSNLHQNKRMPCSYPRKGHQAALPDEMPQTLAVEILRDTAWQLVSSITDNHQRLILLPLDLESAGVRIVFQKSWGGERSFVFACEVGVPDYSQPPPECEWPEPHWTGPRRMSA